MTTIERRLGHMADVLVSNVDKHCHEGELPVRLCNYTDVYHNETVHPGLELMEATATLDEVTRFRLRTGDTVFTKDSETADDIGIPAYVTADADDFVCGYHLAIARPNPREVHPKYLFWWLNSREAAQLWEVRASGVTRVGLRQTDIRQLPMLVVPDLLEQRAIADFLDRETAQIDAMVDAQEQLVALLEERRRTFLTHAVLATTSAGARVDSGLTWLGPIPATWELKPLKYLIDHMDQGWSPQCENYPVEGPDEWGVLKAGCVNGGVFRPRENKKLPEDLEPRPIAALKSGDIVISRANTRDLVGSAAVIEHDHPRLMLSDKLYRMRLTDSAMPGYVAMVLGAAPYREQIELAAGGTSHSMQNISRSDIVTLPVPVPPLHVQDMIVQEVTDVEARTRSMISSAQKSIALMKERRAAVISAAVTGRIDVRTGSEQVERELEEARA